MFIGSISLAVDAFEEFPYCTPHVHTYIHTSRTVRQPVGPAAASIAGGPAFLRCGGASPPAATQSRKTHVAHRRLKIERVYRPYLTALEARPAGVTIMLLG
jgi:hypothetical protein